MSGLDNNKNVNMAIISRTDSQFDDIVDIILGKTIGQICDKVGDCKNVVMVYDSFIGLNNVSYKGFDTIFKFDGLIGIINRYFITNKIDLRADKYMFNGINFVKFVKFNRMKGGEGEDSIVSKTDRNTGRDDIEIVEESKDNDNSKENIKKKIEENRKLINEG